MKNIILSSRRDELINIIKEAFSDSQSHSKALSVRILGEQTLVNIGIAPSELHSTVEAKYGGYPEVAAQGFWLVVKDSTEPKPALEFIDGIRRLKNRTAKGQSFLFDDIALLGLAEGVRQIASNDTSIQIRDIKDWLLEIINMSSQTATWSYRMKQLAGDLLDEKNRLQTTNSGTDVDVQALEIVIRNIWQEQFANIHQLSNSYFERLLAELLRNSPDSTDLEKAVIRVHALDLIIDHSSRILFPRSHKEKIAVERLTRIKAELDRLASAQTKRLLWGYIILLIVFWGLLVLLTIIFTWNTMEPWITFLGVPATIGSYIYFVITQKEFTPPAIYEQIKKAKISKLYKKTGFELDEYEMLVK